MTTPVIAFFNNKGGVGKTSLVYHLAWMYSDLGIRVVAADLDSQANLTAAFLEEERLEYLWVDGVNTGTIFGSVQPLIRGIGDIADSRLEIIEERLALLVGDLRLSGFEDHLSEVWSKCMAGDERAFRVTSAFWRVIQKAAEIHHADLVLMDLGPNLGAINRAALVATDYVVVPLSPDLFSMIGVHNLGPTLRRWRDDWKERLPKNPVSDLSLPSGGMKPLGYVLLQHSVRLDRPVKAYERWIVRIQEAYSRDILGQDYENYENWPVEYDPPCLGLLKHYRSLMPLAQEARKPVFRLKPADGAIGAHYHAVEEAWVDFCRLAVRIARETGISIPGHTTS